MTAKLEIACFNLPNALLAFEAGADRIEFCKEYKLGGLTPDKEEFKQLRRASDTPIFVMIRPRAGNFIYNESEFQQMISDTIYFVNEGADGVVFGILNVQNEIDMVRTERMVHQCRNIEYTFHRAFDSITNQIHATELLHKLSVQNILSSGGEGNANEHTAKLKELQTRSKTCLIVGGGIRSFNIANIHQAVQAKWYHSAALTGNKETLDVNEILNMKKILSA